MKSLPDPALGSAADKLQFWIAHEARLHTIDADLKTPAMALTEEVLKRGRRFIALEKFKGVGFNEAVADATTLMSLFRDFPLDALMAATNIPQLAAAVDAALLHANVGAGRLRASYCACGSWACCFPPSLHGTSRRLSPLVVSCACFCDVVLRWAVLILLGCLCLAPGGLLGGFVFF